ncbi:MAG: D-tyrosyl-tRNA(Tyr) deacylase [Verrucomicrobia bacterium]|jgi:D-tyrosyl-tRNA(Tyr) deacylase|nr:D-tyrosyl-tRNA(Tyr) deacylase [Verrucomicrobiota bacterium]
MRAVLQRVSSAHVSVGGVETGRIGPGLLIFLGVGCGDEEVDADWLAARLLKLRIFESEPGKMDRSVTDVSGECLVISQFTLYGSLKKGNRPSFNRAASPNEADTLYRYFVQRLSADLERPVPTGRFGEHMRVEAQNDGPVTLVVDTKARDF